MTATTSIDQLVATTRPLAPSDAPDLVAFAGADGWLFTDEHGGLAGRGVAWPISLPAGLDDAVAVREVGEQLLAMATDDQVGLPGCGALAMGALPFDRSAPAELVVPAIIVGRRDAQAWVTTIAPAAGGPAGRPGQLPLPVPTPEQAGGSPDEFSLLSPRPHQAWSALVAETVEQIRAGRMDKVVLARTVEVGTNRPIVLPEVLSRLVALYPSCMVFSLDGFIGASPELLVERAGEQVWSQPLAGTVARSGDRASDDALVAALLASPKERWEHRLVVDGLRHTLAPLCCTLEVPAQPSVLGLRNVSHLSTRLAGRLAATDGRTPSALELVAAIHPTAAVAGVPSGVAQAYLRQAEGFDRGRYAGPVGWVDARGDGRFAVGIRSALVRGRHATLYAGVGVVADSDPAAELAETQLKLQALLAAVVRP